MSRATTDQIIAHVDLLRAVDRLLGWAEIVREKRATLSGLLVEIPTEPQPPNTGDAEEVAHAN